ncbi:MAG: acyltransferase 3, partial [Frankiales bacterium]|nr:acyltransferase 3 [Frankiales bacterium]
MTQVGRARHPAPAVRSQAARDVPTFRPDVEGLRAVAVLLVVAGHVLGDPTGGYVGVDVFFVISGFLITGLLLREHARTGRISLREFYARRVRRLMPAAVLVLAVSNVAAWLAFAGERAGQTLRDALWSLGFLANVHFSAIGTNYFDEARPPSPVQHYWSLAVEEQYYLVWPWVLLLLLLALGRRRRLLVLSVAALSAASLVWAVAVTGSDPTAAYFSTPARAWELGAGALLALALQARLLPRLAPRLGAALVWLGLAGIAAAAVLYDERTPFPGTAAALPVAATVLVLLGGTAAGRNPLLVNPIAAYVGRLSYSLYLWHWPVLVVATALVPGRGPLIAVALTGSLVLAVLGHHLVEEPVRRSGWLSGRPAPTR